MAISRVSADKKKKRLTQIVSAVAVVFIFVSVLGGGGLKVLEWVYYSFSNKILEFRVFGPPTPMAIVPNQHGQEPFVITHVGGIEYRIPINYLRYSVKPDHEDGFLLGAALPDMEEMDPKGSEYQKGGWGRKVSILVHDAQSTTSVDFRFGVTKKIYGPLHFRGEQFGLISYLGSKENIAAGQHDPLIPNEQIYEEVFTDNLLEQPSVYIQCNGDKSVPVPGCDAVFNADGLLFEVSFGKNHLSQWRSIKSGAIDLVKRFAAKGDRQ